MEERERERRLALEILQTTMRMLYHHDLIRSQTFEQLVGKLATALVMCAEAECNLWELAKAIGDELALLRAQEKERNKQWIH